MVKVIPTGGCYLRVQRERMLCAVGGGCGAADSSRTGWVPNCLDPTPCNFSQEPLGNVARQLDHTKCRACHTEVVERLGYSYYSGRSEQITDRGDALVTGMPRPA